MRLIVVGTGTDVGKTHVSACLLAHARALGLRGGAYKPIATGVGDRCEDTDRLAEALGTPVEVPTFSYQEPVSPYWAARSEGRPIDLEVIGECADRMHLGLDVFLVETAGGLFSPIAESEALPERAEKGSGHWPGSRALSNVDLVKRLLPGVVLLVAPDRLGVLHDVSATLLAAAACELRITAVVLSCPEARDTSTGTNAEQIERIGFPAPLGVFPRAAFDALESRDAAAAVFAKLALSH